jgi:hypothetical protein
MKTTALIPLALIAMLAMAVTASAQCTAVLADGLAPNGGSVQVGDVIEYSMTVSVPNVPSYCTLTDVSVYFFPPPGEADPCDNTGSGILIDSGLTLTPGGPVYTWTSADNAALQHTVTLADLTDADGADIVADMATTFIIQGGTGDLQCDESSSVVYGTNPCIEIEKDVCGYSKVGDEVSYEICITNCSVPAAPLYTIVVYDELLGGTLPGFPSELGPDETFCQTFTYVVQEGDPDPLINTAEVSGEDEYGNAVMDEDDASVDLLHPSFSIMVECMTDPVEPGGDADFLITFTNDGDVPLDISTDESSIMPFTLPDSYAETRTVTVSDPGGVDCVYYEINVTATIPPEFCELPNTYTAFGDACCPIEEEGEQGCTPGYWKTHPECWECYTTDTPLGDVFTFPTELASFESYTLMEAMKFGGGAQLEGAVRNLMRSASAALQNACDADIAYPMGVSGVISFVNDALATLDRREVLEAHAELDMYNNYGCPQDAHCIPIVEEEGFIR